MKDFSVADRAVPSTDAVQAVRRFNRFFTRRIGVLDPYLGSTLSLTDVRVLYELAHRESSIARTLARDLGLDGGYLSRILGRFEAAGWLHRTPSPTDARQSLLTLTEAGRAAFEPLQRRSREEAAALLAPLGTARQMEVVSAMERIEALLEPAAATAMGTDIGIGTRIGTTQPRTALLRDPAPGDIGWVVQLHGEVYAREYGWNMEFEALVADIAAQFVRKFQPAWEKCWIAELDGQRVGAVFVVRKSATTAQLRMLILAPQARGLGLGGRLTDECIGFARQKGYARITLWTNSCLEAARGIYAARGFALVKSAPYEGFGLQLVGETWALDLRPAKTRHRQNPGNPPGAGVTA